MVRDAVSELPDEVEVPITYSGEDGKDVTTSYKVVVDPKIKSDIVKQFANSDMYNAFGFANSSDEINIDGLREDLPNVINSKIFGHAVASVAKQHAEKMVAGLEAKLKAIPNRQESINDRRPEPVSSVVPNSIRTNQDKIKDQVIYR